MNTKATLALTPKLSNPSARFNLVEFLSKTTACAGAAAAVLLAVDPAQALTLVTSSVALGPTDSFDWSVLGPEFTTVTNPFSITSTSTSRNATVSQTSGSFGRRDQSTGWGGNFGIGEELLWTEGGNGPMSITFDALVSGAGSQIQRNQYGDFTAVIEAFDAGNNSLGSFNLAGLSNFADDDSAIFIGVQDTSSTIARLTFSVPSTEDFAISQLEFSTASVASVPGPLPVMGLAVGFAYRRKLRKRIKDSKLPVASAIG